MPERDYRQPPIPSGWNSNRGAFYRGKHSNSDKALHIVAGKLLQLGTRQVARSTHVRTCEKTVLRLWRKWLQHDTLGPLPKGRSYFKHSQSKLCRFCILWIRVYLQTFPKGYIWEVREELYRNLGVAVSERTLQRLFEALRLTRKRRIKQAAEKLRPENQLRDAQFQQLRATIPVDRVCVLDEVAIKDVDIFRMYGRCEASARHVHVDKKGASPTTMFICAALHDRVLDATLPVPSPIMVTGYVFDFWLQYILIPQLQPGTWIVLDNAHVHRRQPVFQLCNFFGMHVLFLPPYSPEYNWCEYVFAFLRQRLASNVVESRTATAQAVRQHLLAIPAQHLRNTARHCGWQ